VELSTVANSSLGFAACLSKNPDFLQSTKLPLYKEKLRILQSYEKVESRTKLFALFCAAVFPCAMILLLQSKKTRHLVGKMIFFRVYRHA
jgi:hypothetical protein